MDSLIQSVGEETEQVEEEDKNSDVKAKPSSGVMKTNKNQIDDNVDNKKKTTEQQEEVKTLEKPVNSGESFWDTIRDEESPKKPKNVLTTFYLEPDLHEIITDLYKINGKGFKSQLINESLRFTLSEKGLLDR